MARKKIGAMLEEKGLINEFQLVAALSHQRKWKTKLGQSLIELGYLEEPQLYSVLAEQLELEYVDLRKTEIPFEVLRRVNKDYAREWQALPISFDGNTWTVATSEPDRPGLSENLAAMLSGPIKLVLATPSALEAKIRKIPDKVPVATVQPVKKAFVRDENGAVIPAPEPTSPPGIAPLPPSFLREDSPLNIEIPLVEPEPPPVSPTSAPASPAGEEELVEEPPEIFQSRPGEGGGDVVIEAPPLEEAIPLGEPEETEIPLEAAHETQAIISQTTETPSADELVGLDDLLPPPLQEAPLTEPPAAVSPPPDSPSPPAEESPPPSSEDSQEKVPDLTHDTSKSKPSEIIDMGEEIIEAPPLDSGGGFGDLLETRADKTFPEEEPAPATTESEEEMQVPSLELDLPPAEEEKGDLATPEIPPPLVDLPPSDLPSAEEVDLEVEAGNLPPPLSEPLPEKETAPPAVASGAEIPEGPVEKVWGAESSKANGPGPERKELTPPIFEEEPSSLPVPDLELPPPMAPSPSHPAEKNEEPSLVGPAEDAPLLPPEIPGLELPGDLPAAVSAAVPPPPVEEGAGKEPPPSAPPKTEKLEPAAGVSPAPEDEDTMELLERIHSLESQIQGMTAILNQLKEMLRKKKEKKT